MRDVPFTCSETEAFADAYLDGELAAEDRVELEAHFTACPRCERVMKTHGALKARVRSSVTRARLPDALRARIDAAIQREAPHVARPRFGRSLTMIPAVAAISLLAFAVASTHHGAPVAADAVMRHRLDLPVEVTGGDENVSRWFDHKLAFAVHPPHLAHAAFLGARLANIRDHLAADLVYQVDGKKVSVFVFDPSDLAIEAPHRRQSGKREVFLGEDHGYHVALFRDHGVAYALAAELSEETLFELASSATMP